MSLPIEQMKHARRCIQAFAGTLGARYRPYHLTEEGFRVLIQGQSHNQGFNLDLSVFKT